MDDYSFHVFNYGGGELTYTMSTRPGVRSISGNPLTSTVFIHTHSEQFRPEAPLPIPAAGLEP